MELVAIGEGEQRVVTTQAHVGARVELGAALAHDDVASGDSFAAEALYAEALAF